MNQENIRTLSFEDKEKIGQDINNIISNKSGKTDTINPINEVQNNKNNNDIKENKINKSSNEPNEGNIINNSDENKNENNININNINESNDYYGNEIACNTNYMSQNIQSNNNEFNNSKPNNIKIQEIMVGNRRIERYDGAECNNQNDNRQNHTQFSNNQLIFPEQININEINNSEYNFIPINAYNEHMHQSPIYNNLNEIQSQEQFNPQFQNNSPHTLNVNVNPNQACISKFNNSPRNDDYMNNKYNHQCNQIYQNTLLNTQISQQMNPEYFETSNRVKTIPQKDNKNITVKVLYPKPGYGNTEEEQNKLKKKKKIKYVRRSKPLLEQHFDVQIIQSEEEGEIPSNYQSYPEKQNQYRNNYPMEQPNPQKIISHIPNKYRMKKYGYNAYRKSEFCNCDEYQSDDNSNEELERNNLYYSCTCKSRQRQTIINVTPMRTINRWNSNNNIPYNNRERQFRTEGYKSYIYMTPSKYMNNENVYYALERNDGHTFCEPNRKGVISFFPKNINSKNSYNLYNENEEMNNEIYYPSSAREKRINMRNNY